MQESERSEALLREILDSPKVLMTPELRKIARREAKELKSAPGEDVLELCNFLVEHGGSGRVRRVEHGPAYESRMVAFDLAWMHQGAFALLNWRELERLGRTMDGWASVDHFARKLSGPAWQRGQITDARVMKWATSSDFWWRRTGLVSTIALNERHLGKGDAARTLAICELFVDDRADLHVKALSWALRELGIRDPDAVIEFVLLHEDRLAPRVLREVRNKLETGHKQAKPSEAMSRRMRERRAT
ncbi:MAG: DNA alkylation repair protein [Chloroflexi bacterium]|nr:DNA alkylation repair protein [Chloroflexota bacterium]MYF23006.1 DNA alkylation repair protein [Chloroflexota bacterium]